MLYVYDKIASTIDVAIERLSDDIDILAMEQTNGVGKQKRIWDSPRDNLYLSMNMDNLAKNGVTQEDLSVYFGVLTGLTIQSFKEIDIKYKFPNDLYINGKKVAGLLIDIYDDRMIVSIGCNLRRSIEEFANLYDYKIRVTPVEFYTVLKSFIEQYQINNDVLRFIKKIWMENLL